MNSYSTYLKAQINWDNIMFEEEPSEEEKIELHSQKLDNDYETSKDRLLFG